MPQSRIEPTTAAFFSYSLFFFSMKKHKLSVIQSLPESHGRQLKKLRRKISNEVTSLESTISKWNPMATSNQQSFQATLSPSPSPSPTSLPLNGLTMSIKSISSSDFTSSDDVDLVNSNDGSPFLDRAAPVNSTATTGSLKYSLMTPSDGREEGTSDEGKRAGGVLSVSSAIIDNDTNRLNLSRRTPRLSAPSYLPSQIPTYTSNSQINYLELAIPPDIPPLGQGFFGEVRVGYWKNYKVACKILYGKSFKNKTDRELFLTEISILSELNHPNVIQYYGTCVDELRRNIIVIEFMENGSLDRYIKHALGDYSILLKLAKDVAKGMEFLHERSILHRDLAAKNILLTRNMLAKVADFGLSKKKIVTNSLNSAGDCSTNCSGGGRGNCTSSGSDTIKKTDLAASNIVGTIPWQAPEVIVDPSSFSCRSDVYSYAILVWEMLSGEDPCPKGQYSAVASMVVNNAWRPDIPPDTPPLWISLISKCWDQNPQGRPTFSIILKFIEEMEFYFPPPAKITYQYSPSTGGNSFDNYYNNITDPTAAAAAAAAGY